MWQGDILPGSNKQAKTWINNPVCQAARAMRWQHDLGDSKHPDLVLTTPLTGSRMRSGCRRAVALTFTAKNASEPVTPSTLKLSRVPQHSQCWGRERFPLPSRVSSLVGPEQGEPSDQHSFPSLGR